MDADRVAKGKYAEGVRQGKWKKRTFVARSDTHPGTDLRPIDAQQGTFSDKLDNSVPFDPINPCYMARVEPDEPGEELDEADQALLDEDPNYTIIDPENESEHGVFYANIYDDSEDDA